MQSSKYLFTSESVGEGHPDKLCDQVSDAVLDACLTDDPESHVACECYATTGMILIGGEITTSTYVDIQQLARDVVYDIGYDNPDYGIDYESMAVLNSIHSQSPRYKPRCGRQGTQGVRWQAGRRRPRTHVRLRLPRRRPELMPAPLMFAHKILQRAAQLRKAKDIPWLRPDAKEPGDARVRGPRAPAYRRRPSSLLQHDPEIAYDTIKETIIEKIIRPILEPTGLLRGDTKFFINPTGRFVIGRPCRRYGPHGPQNHRG